MFKIIIMMSLSSCYEQEYFENSGLFVYHNKKPVQFFVITLTKLY